METRPGALVVTGPTVLEGSTGRLDVYTEMATRQKAEVLPGLGTSGAGGVSLGLTVLGTM